MGQQRPQQTPRRDHMVLVGLLLKILQRIQRLRALLDLVKDDQRRLRLDLLPSHQRQQLNDPLRVLVMFKNRLQRVLFVEVKINIPRIGLPPKFLHQPGLPHLPRPLEHQGLALFVGFPAEQVLHGISFHLVHRLYQDELSITHFLCGFKARKTHFL